jgi:hypothetical protein
MNEIITFGTDTVLKSKPQFLEMTPPTGRRCEQCPTRCCHPARRPQNIAVVHLKVTRNRRFCAVSRCLVLRVVQKSRITPEEAEEARAAAVKAARGARVHPRRILIEACVIFRLQITALQA